jgi:capsular polysaccharide biosynthesis protein
MKTMFNLIIGFVVGLFVGIIIGGMAIQLKK